MSVIQPRPLPQDAKVDQRRLDDCLYVVNNWPGGGNDRVRKVLRLGERFQRLVLVTPGREDRDEPDTLMARPFPNPLGILRLAGLHELKRLAESYLLFPGVTLLFTSRVKGTLTRRIAADLAAGRSVTLLTTAPPHALGLLGLHVKRRFPEVRWVIDWQDLWSYDENYYLTVPALYRPRLRRLERRMLVGADLNVTTNGRARRVLEEQYGVAPDRLVDIHHHFDESDFRRAPQEPLRRPDGDAIRIGFLGTLFKPPRVPGLEIVDAITAMRASGLNVELHVHGYVPKERRAALENIPGLHLHGRVSHEESINLLGDYDYLLLLLSDLPNCRVVMSIKLPPYMAAGRPVLAVVPHDSAIADIVTRTGTGFVLPVEEDWRSQLRAILERHDVEGAFAARRQTAIETFSWSYLSERWLQALARPNAAD